MPENLTPVTFAIMIRWGLETPLHGCLFMGQVGQGGLVQFGTWGHMPAHGHQLWPCPSMVPEPVTVTLMVL